MPVSCKLTTPELQKRKATVVANLKSLALERTELEDGFSCTFEGKDEILDKLNDFIKTERMCCDFFHVSAHHWREYRSTQNHWPKWRQGTPEGRNGPLTPGR